MFRIACKELLEQRVNKVLASHSGGLGSIPGQDMSVSGPLVKDGDDLGQVSP
jgi:hypothetical protein